MVRNETQFYPKGKPISTGNLEFPCVDYNGSKSSVCTYMCSYKFVYFRDMKIYEIVTRPPHTLNCNNLVVQK